MEILLISILFLLSIFFLVLEVFLIPGISLAGIAAAGCMLAAHILVFLYFGSTTGLAVLAVSLTVCLLLGIWLVRSRVLDRISLKRTIDTTAATSEQLSVREGDRGMTRTRLALIGNAEIEGKLVEVQSADGFLDENTPVIVCRVLEGRIWVRRAEKETRTNNPH